MIKRSSSINLKWPQIMEDGSDWALFIDWLEWLYALINMNYLHLQK